MSLGCSRDNQEPKIYKLFPKLDLGKLTDISKVYLRLFESIYDNLSNFGPTIKEMRKSLSLYITSLLRNVDKEDVKYFSCELFLVDYLREGDILEIGSELLLFCSIVKSKEVLVKNKPRYKLSKILRREDKVFLPEESLSLLLDKDINTRSQVNKLYPDLNICGIYYGYIEYRLYYLL